MAVRDPKDSSLSKNRSKQQRTEKFDIRLSPQEESLIKQAAEITATTPTNFIRQQAVVGAQSILHEQTRFVVTSEQWQKIDLALNSPAKVLPNLLNQLKQLDEWNT